MATEREQLDGNLRRARRAFKTGEERAIYEHYLGGSERGDLYVYVKRGMAGIPLNGGTPNQRAAWIAGQDRLALRTQQPDTVPSDDEGRVASVARMFHETYERLAPEFGYETREETRSFDPESINGRLMIAVCGKLIAALNATQPTDAEVREVVKRLKSLRREMEVRFTGQFVENTLCTIDSAIALLERLSPAAVRREALEEAARIAEKRAEERFDEFGVREPDTNATYYEGQAAETYEALDEEDWAIAAAIRQHKDSDQ